MSHPDDLLADYVDATLPPAARAEVEGHLASCTRCTGDVAMATQASRALAALAAPPAPEGLADAAIEEARAAHSPSAAAPRWYRVAGVAAAAAIVALAAVTLPHLGGEQRSNKTEIAPGAGLASSGPERGSDNIGTAAPIQIVLLKGRSYSAVDLQDLATSTASASASAPTGTSGTADETASAIRCLATAGAPTDAQLVTLIGAAFEKNPAAIGVYLQGPGADQPADKVLVLAASLDTCQVLSFVQANIG